MENFRSCPICLEVPENEIFQCSAGHVICHSCVLKVDNNRCPQCRIPFGNPKIRNRALEEILDAQDFPCKFKDNGCSRLLKRKELTTHGRLCSHNPDTVALCWHMGMRHCSFRVGCASRTEILLHFSNVHGLSLNKNSSMMVDLLKHVYGCVCVPWNVFGIPRKLGTEDMFGDLFFYLTSCDDLDTSPLFLIHGKWNNAIKCWSLACMKVWESGAYPTVKYIAEFSFINNLTPIPNRGHFYGDISSTNIIQFGGKMTVCSIQEAPQFLETSPINIPNLLLEKHGFGSRNSDKLLVKISRA